MSPVPEYFWACFSTFRFRFSGGYPFHESPYWCCFWAAVKTQCGKKYWGSLALNLELYVDMLIYLLTAIGLTLGGSSTVHIYTQTIDRTTQLIKEACGPCSIFVSYSLAFALQLKEKHRRNLVREAEECQLAR